MSIELTPDARQRQAAHEFKERALSLLADVVSKLTGYKTECAEGTYGAIVDIYIRDVPAEKIFDVSSQVYQLERDLFDGLARGRFSVGVYTLEDRKLNWMD